MPAPAPPPSRLEQIAQRERRRASRGPAAGDEHCELCSASIPADHPHLLDLEHHEVHCACRACAVLFDRRAAGGGKLRRVPDRRRRLHDFRDVELLWAALGIPVDLAFLVRHERETTVSVAAYYPGPAGVVGGEVDEHVWCELVEANPLVDQLEPDVEALMVRRHGARTEHYLVPIDDCFRLVALLRGSWSGLSGGDEVWRVLTAYFDDLATRCKVVHATSQGQEGR